MTDRASVAELREGLAESAGAIGGVATSAYARDTCRAPEVVVLPPEQINYDRTFGGGADYTFPVRIYATKTSTRNAQAILDRYVSEEGPDSLKAALEADQTLNARASWVSVHQVRGYGSYTIGETDYIGAELVVIVHA